MKLDARGEIDLDMIEPDVPILPGLKIAEDLNTFYDDEKLYDQTEKLGSVLECLQICGSFSKCLCYPCAPLGCGPLMQINQGEMGLLLNKGKLVRKLGPGLHTYNTCLDELIKVSMKTKIMSVPEQLLMTRDNVTISMTAFVAYNIEVPEYAIFRCDSVEELISNLTQGTMKTIVATMKLDELLTRRRDVERYITYIIDKKTDYYGVNVSSIDTLNMDLPKVLEEALISAALSERDAKAKIIQARGNLESAKYVRNSADELSKNRVSLQLQYFEILKKLAEDKPTKLILPYFLSDF